VLSSRFHLVDLTWCSAHSSSLWLQVSVGIVTGRGAHHTTLSAHIWLENSQCAGGCLNDGWADCTVQLADLCQLQEQTARQWGVV
jgi:hypothetical protein